MRLLQEGAVLGVQRCSDGLLHLFINDKDQGIAATNVPQVVAIDSTDRIWKDFDLPAPTNFELVLIFTCTFLGSTYSG